MSSASLSQALMARNPWNATLDAEIYPALCWERVVAALLHDLPIGIAAAVFANVVEQIAEKLRDTYATIYDTPPFDKRAPLTFETWLAAWSKIPFMEPVDTALLELADTQVGDVAFGLRALANSDASPEAVLLFLAGVIAEWLTGDDQQIGLAVTAHPWLRKLRGLQATLATERMFLHFYDQLVEDEDVPTDPLPADVKAGGDAFGDELYAPRIDLNWSYIQTPTVAADNPGIRAILGQGAQWLSAASHIALARNAGLITRSGFDLTALGRKMQAWVLAPS